jgi:hypothetical protein
MVTAALWRDRSIAGGIVIRTMPEATEPLQDRRLMADGWLVVNASRHACHVFFSVDLNHRHCARAMVAAPRKDRGDLAATRPRRVDDNRAGQVAQDQ